jgi:MYXO-CTERM domain-containing protein
LAYFAAYGGEPVGTLLEDGTVLVIGGRGEGGIPLATAELFKLLSNGTLCDQATDCQSGFCVDGVCCDTACDAGPCDVCSVRTELTPMGGQTAGVCQPVNGVKCDDADACTQTDVCQNGACQGMTPVVCKASDDCHEPGECNTKTGGCSPETAKAAGATCDDGNLCTTLDRCQSEVCTGNLVTCPLPDQCHKQGSCDPSTGMCDNPAKDDGADCDDVDACTQLDRCESGTCVGQNLVVCPPPDSCHKPSTCDHKTGLCDNPAKDDGAGCDDGNDCTTEDRCQGGACTGTQEVNCACPECGRYVCFGASRSCKTSCDSVNDCAPGYVCDRMNQCVPPPPDTHNEDNSGCALAPPAIPEGSLWPPAALSLLALGALGARRRRTSWWRWARRR